MWLQNIIDKLKIFTFVAIGCFVVAVIGATYESKTKRELEWKAFGYVASHSFALIILIVGRIKTCIIPLLPCLEAIQRRKKKYTKKGETIAFYSKLTSTQFQIFVSSVIHFENTLRIFDHYHWFSIRLSWICKNFSHSKIRKKPGLYWSGAV